MVVKSAVRGNVPKAALPAFTPVPRKQPRHDGWTPERQKAVIEALADTGCVSIACRMVNMSQPSFYQLRRQPGAESFRAAADAAQTLGLQPVKDEAFDRAMNGQLVPVFVAGKLMGFRRKKNDRLLMFILRHYGQDKEGRKTTINYFSTRASAGAAATTNPSPLVGEGDSRSERGEGCGGKAAALAEASTTTVKTVISGNANVPNRIEADDEAANLLNNFEGVDLDAEAQAEIYRALESCAERRRALAEDSANDPERIFVSENETLAGYAGELESGVEGDWVEYKPEGEYRWEGLGEGGEAAEVDKVLAEIAERRAKLTPDEIAAEQAEHEAEVRRMRERRALPAPVEPDPDDPRLDWRNWSDSGYTAPSAVRPEPVEGLGFDPSEPAKAEGKRSPEPSRRARKPYKKRQPKPSFTALTATQGEAAYEARKAQAVAAVEAERRVGAAAEEERRRRRKERQP